MIDRRGGVPEQRQPVLEEIQGQEHAPLRLDHRRAAAAIGALQHDLARAGGGLAFGGLAGLAGGGPGGFARPRRWRAFGAGGSPGAAATVAEGCVAAR